MVRVDNSRAGITSRLHFVKAQTGDETVHVHDVRTKCVENLAKRLSPARRRPALRFVTGRARRDGVADNAQIVVLISGDSSSARPRRHDDHMRIASAAGDSGQTGAGAAV